jgi:hypothetical protein
MLWIRLHSLIVLIGRPPCIQTTELPFLRISLNEGYGISRSIGRLCALILPPYIVQIRKNNCNPIVHFFHAQHVPLFFPSSAKFCAKKSPSHPPHPPPPPTWQVGGQVTWAGSRDPQVKSDTCSLTCQNGTKHTHTHTHSDFSCRFSILFFREKRTQVEKVTLSAQNVNISVPLF